MHARSLCHGTCTFFCVLQAMLQDWCRLGHVSGGDANLQFRVHLCWAAATDKVWIATNCSSSHGPEQLQTRSTFVQLLTQLFVHKKRRFNSFVAHRQTFEDVSPYDTSTALARKWVDGTFCSKDTTPSPTIHLTSYPGFCPTAVSFALHSYSIPIFKDAWVGSSNMWSWQAGRIRTTIHEAR